MAMAGLALNKHMNLMALILLPASVSPILKILSLVQNGLERVPTGFGKIVSRVLLIMFGIATITIHKQDPIHGYTLNLKDIIQISSGWK